MSLLVKHAGSWKPATPYVKVGGSWVAVARVSVNDAGVWKEIFVVAPPP